MTERAVRPPSNKRLQLPSHSAFQSTSGRVGIETWALRSGHGGAVARS